MSRMLIRWGVRLAEVKARGQAMPEYAVIAAAIIVAAYLIFQTVGTQVSNTMQSVANALGA